jgi:GT2 family glycosyltransferase
LIDNEYQKGMSDQLKKSEKIHIIKNKNNEGFARANNQGIRYSIKNGFDYMLLLNNDTLIKNDLLDSLIKHSSNLNKKIIQPLILNYDGTKIWNAGGAINYFLGTFQTLKKGLNFKNFNSNKDYTDWFTGCCVLIKSDIFKDIGYFDEKFFAYYEDIDFSIRLKKMGYSIALMTDSYLQHYESASSKSINKSEGNLSPYVHYLNIRNHILLLKKHSKSFNTIGVLFYQLIKILSYLIYFLIRFRFNKFKMVLKGFIDAINFKK